MTANRFRFRLDLDSVFHTLLNLTSLSDIRNWQNYIKIAYISETKRGVEMAIGSYGQWSIFVRFVRKNSKWSSDHFMYGRYYTFPGGSKVRKNERLPVLSVVTCHGIFIVLKLFFHSGSQNSDSERYFLIGGRLAGN